MQHCLPTLLAMGVCSSEMGLSDCLGRRGAGISASLHRKAKCSQSKTREEKRKKNRRFNVASHMGSISCVFYSSSECVCVCGFQSEGPSEFKGMQSWRHV